MDNIVKQLELNRLENKITQVFHIEKFLKRSEK